MPHRTEHRYCRCNARLAADNPSDQCLACTRKEQEYLQRPPDLPFEYWLIDRFDDAFAAQHIGLVLSAYRNCSFHHRPITQEQLGTWLGLSQPEVSRIESGPPIRHLDRLAYLARTIKVPPQLLWFDLPGQRRTAVDARDRQAAPLHPAAAHADQEQPATEPSQPHHGDERDGRSGHDDDLVIPDDLAAMLEAGGQSSASGLLELLAGAGGLMPVTGLAPAGLVPVIGAGSSSLSGFGIPPAPSTGRSLALGDGRYQVMARFGEVLLVALDRRLFLIRTGLAPGLAIPLADAEGTRQGLARTMLGDGRGSAEDWHAIVRQHCVTYLHTLPAEVFVRLSSDLAVLRGTFGQERSESGQNELRQAGALLAELMSSTAANLGDLSACERWAWTARQLADASGDLHTRLWVRGREVRMGLFQRRPVGELMHAAEDAVALGEADGPPHTAAWPQLMGATAQVLAMTGRRSEAEAALNRTRSSFEAVPDTMRDGSVLDFSEHNLRYTEGYVYTYLDEYGKAEAAQDAALTVLLRMPPRDQRSPAQVELMRALCSVRMGDTTAGVAHARETIGRLPPARRVHTVLDLGRKVIEAVPAEERRGEEVMGLRELVGVR